MRQSTEGTLVYDEVGSVSDKNDVDDKNGKSISYQWDFLFNLNLYGRNFFN